VPPCPAGVGAGLSASARVPGLCTNWKSVVDGQRIKELS
jgi:hypothetical protein